MTAEDAAPLRHAKPLFERGVIHQPPPVAAFADMAHLVEGLDLEADDAALHLNHLGRGAHLGAGGRCREMADVDLGADGDPAGLQASRDGIARRHLHFQDHHRRRIDQRHVLDKIPDRALRRHHQGALGAHANLDEIACVHGCFNNLVIPDGPRNAGRSGISTFWREIPGSALPGCPRMTERHFFCAAARSTNVLPPFILWISGASLIWITTASASTPRFFTSAWVMSRIMPAFCSSVRPAAMFTVISGIALLPLWSPPGPACAGDPPSSLSNRRWTAGTRPGMTSPANAYHHLTSCRARTSRPFATMSSSLHENCAARI